MLAVVTHLATAPDESGRSVERLRCTLDGLLQSLDHARVELVLNTIAESHVAAELPGYLRSRIEVRERSEVEPLFLGFEAQDEYVRRRDDFEWFFYLEDDLVLGDSLVLEKLEYFDGSAPNEALLLPHRYELFDGKKVYMDLRSKWAPGEERTTSRLTAIEIGGWRFAEFPNPHSGCYFLSRRQLARWLDTGRRWYGLASYQGPREAAATGCLEECFRIYKPHPDNMNFFEIQHLGTKYSELYTGIHGADDA